MSIKPRNACSCCTTLLALAAQQQFGSHYTRFARSRRDHLQPLHIRIRCRHCMQRRCLIEKERHCSRRAPPGTQTEHTTLVVVLVAAVLTLSSGGYKGKRKKPAFPPRSHQLPRPCQPSNRARRTCKGRGQRDGHAGGVDRVASSLWCRWCHPPHQRDEMWADQTGLGHLFGANHRSHTRRTAAARPHSTYGHARTTVVRHLWSVAVGH